MVELLNNPLSLDMGSVKIQYRVEQVSVTGLNRESSKSCYGPAAVKGSNFKIMSLDFLGRLEGAVNLSQKNCLFVNHRYDLREIGRRFLVFKILPLYLCIEAFSLSTTKNLLARRRFFFL